MKEIQGNLWDYYGNPDFVLCITTNGTVKKNGAGVMGRGCAQEASERDRKLPLRLGTHIRANGNKPFWLSYRMISFPVKHNWWEKADIELIRQSANWLEGEANNLNQLVFILPRPGCGNGKLDWSEVKSVIQFLPSNVWVISR